MESFRLAPVQARKRKSVADLHAFHGPNTHEGTGQPRTELAEYGIAQSGRQSKHLELYDATHRIGVLARGQNGFFHGLRRDRVRATDGIILDGRVNAGLGLDAADLDGVGHDLDAPLPKDLARHGARCHAACRLAP